MPDMFYDMGKSRKRFKELCDEREITAVELAETFQVSTDELMIRKDSNDN